MATQSISDAVPVLLTRPEPEASAFAQALVAAHGNRLRPVVAPLMAVEYLRPEISPERFRGVIFTSSAGVGAAMELGVELPHLAWCVGEKTAERARAAGFQAQVGEGDADGLVKAIRAARQEGPLLHLRGEETRGQVAERLNSAGIETNSAVVYRQVAQPLTGEAVELLRHPGVLVVPLFSPRTAALFVSALPAGLQAELRLIAMSAAVAAELGGRAAVIAERPDAAAMTEAIGRALR